MTDKGRELALAIAKNAGRPDARIKLFEFAKDHRPNNEVPELGNARNGDFSAVRGLKRDIFKHLFEGSGLIDIDGDRTVHGFLKGEKLGERSFARPPSADD